MRVTRNDVGVLALAANEIFSSILMVFMYEA